MSRDLDIAAFVLSAPRLALLGPLATCSERSRTILIVKTALLALVQFFIACPERSRGVFLNDFDHNFSSSKTF